MGRLTRDLCAVATRAMGPAELGETFAGAVRSCVAFDGLRVVCTNPAAALGLGSFSCWHNYDRELLCDLVLDRYLGGDPCRPEDLDRQRVAVDVIGAESGFGLRSRQTARLLAKHGASGELRSLLRDRHGVWGFLGLLRAAGGRPFGQDDIERVARLGPALTAAIRAYVRGRPPAVAPPPPLPGVIIVGPDHRIQGISPEAHAWLEQLWMPGGSSSDWTAKPFATELSCRTKELAGVGITSTPLICASASGSGRWIAVHGRRMGADDTSDVAVVIEAARGELLLPSFCHWYELTGRERSVLERLCTGDPPRTIAKTLGVSAHTINDHLKALYRKTGTYGRDELLAILTT
ncbi:helix-turn-helix transcriptional regulator [Nocardia arthritidis]|nr:helix-turn-helix transcriptional regulator [Nocardia arthritidis]